MLFTFYAFLCFSKEGESLIGQGRYFFHNIDIIPGQDFFIIRRDEDEVLGTGPNIQ